VCQSSLTSGKNDDGLGRTIPDLGDSIDIMTFNQILEMDDPDDREFSKSIVEGFFEQANETFDSMDEAL
jgi:osomolarity two-component system, phosphorelay intermediate protein YPD1